MPRRPKLTHVRSHLTATAEMCDILLTAKTFTLPPAYQDYVKQIGFLSRAILRKHAAKGTRKDVYIETH